MTGRSRQTVGDRELGDEKKKMEVLNESLRASEMSRGQIARGDLNSSQISTNSIKRQSVNYNPLAGSQKPQ
jgi:hypothetical protein